MNIDWPATRSLRKQIRENLAELIKRKAPLNLIKDQYDKLGVVVLKKDSPKAE